MDIDKLATLKPTSVVVQVKGSATSVGKSQVRDIRDTVEYYGAQGYFLAVSTELTSPLIEQLEVIGRDRGWVVDWWTRLEIENRLRRHPDIARRYEMVAWPKGREP